LRIPPWRRGRAGGERDDQRRERHDDKTAEVVEFAVERQRLLEPASGLFQRSAAEQGANRVSTAAPQ
jgi:hypothetical protein